MASSSVPGVGRAETASECDLRENEKTSPSGVSVAAQTHAQSFLRGNKE